MKELIVTKASYKSHVYNEDRILIKDNLFIVMDGASSLTETDKRPTSASWLVNRLKKELSKRIDDVVDKLYFLSKSLYLEYGSPRNTLYLPSCGMSICEVKGEKVRFLTIGDCEVAYLTKDGKINFVKYDELNALDNKAIEEMVNVSKKESIPMLEARKMINNLLIHNRKLMNRENGYQVYTISDNPNFRFKELEEDIDIIKDIYIYSDGYAQAYSTLGLYSKEELFSKDLDIVEVKDRILETWCSDAKCERFPRFKKADDISVVKIKINNLD